MLASDLITEALEEICAVTAGDDLTTVDGAKGLAVLNRLIASTNINRGNIFSIRSDVYTLVSGQQDYTIGVDPASLLTADLDGPRPIRLTKMNLLMPAGANTVKRKITILTTEQWASKTLTNVSGIPIEVYPDGGNPLTTWSFYQIPNQAWQVEAWTWQQAAALSALTAVIQIPDGYYEFWLYSLAARLAAPFGATVSPVTLELLREARSDVQALNAPSPRIAGDSDLDPGALGLYNWLSGTDEDY